MRRLLRAIARGEEISQDISTLENPAIVAQLRGEEAPQMKARSQPKRKATSTHAGGASSKKRTRKAVAKSKSKTKEKAKVKRTAAKSRVAKRTPARAKAKLAARGKSARRRVQRRLKRVTRPRRPARRSTK